MRAFAATCQAILLTSVGVDTLSRVFAAPNALAVTRYLVEQRLVGRYLGITSPYQHELKPGGPLNRLVQPPGRCAVLRRCIEG